MNLTKFLKIVDCTMGKLTKEKLEAVLHDIARTIPEHQREEFIERMERLGNINIKKKLQNAEENETGDSKKEKQNQMMNHIDAGYRHELQEKTLQIQKKLQQIEEEELCIVGEINDEYDDWYNSSVEEFIFQDPQGVADILETACSVIHQCVDAELYAEAYEIADRLLTIRICVDGDYADFGCGGLTLQEMVNQPICRIDYDQLVLDTLYAAYQAKPLRERPEAVYQVFKNANCSDMKLETLLQAGNTELKEVDEFLPLWIAYLGECRGNQEDSLLSEAVALQNNLEKELQYARQFYALHPGLYEQILKKNRPDKNAEEMLAIGKEALAVIPIEYRIRSRIALQTAEYAGQMGKREEMEDCWLEAFRSDTRPVHYLRLAVESQDFSKYQDTVRIIYQQYAKKDEPGYDMSTYISDLRRNVVGSVPYAMLKFLDGNWTDIIHVDMNVKDSVGWSGTFMKSGMALFLLYLYKGMSDSIESLPAGCNAMCRKIVMESLFTAQEYVQGLDYSVQKEDTLLFWECFSKWKEKVSMPKAEQEKLIEKLENWVERRVEGIMKGNYRRCYRECAEYVAALGEVKESRGEMNGKAYFMESYRAAYSRRTAFHGELRAMGMRGKRS